MPPKNEALYLEDLLEAIQKALKYTEGGKEAFFSDPMVQDAVALNLIVIGEAAKKLSEATKQKAREVPWRQVAGLRDRLSHTYSTADLRVVWQVVERELRPLQESAQRLRSSLESGE